MSPAQQSLGADDARAVRRHDRLVVHVEGLIVDRTLELALNEAAVVEVGVHRWREDDESAALGAFGGAERKVGTTVEIVAAQRVLRRMRNAGGDVDLHGLIVHPERLGQNRRDGADGSLGVFHAWRGHHHGELVAVEPAAERALRKRGHEALGQFEKKLIPALVTERVVDVVQPVEIDQREGDDLLRDAARERRLDQLNHLAMVRQAGEHVLMRQPPGAPLAGAEIVDGAADLPERDARKTDQQSSGCGKERIEAAQRIGERAIRLPTEPADDAALPVEHRLHVAVAHDRVDFEAEVLEARRPLHRPDGARIERGEVRAARAQVFYGPEQRCSAFELLLIIGLLDQYGADDPAEQDQRQNEQRESGDNSRRGPPARLGRLIQGDNTHDWPLVRRNSPESQAIRGWLTPGHRFKG